MNLKGSEQLDESVDLGQRLSSSLEELKKEQAQDPTKPPADTDGSLSGQGLDEQNSRGGDEGTDKSETKGRRRAASITPPPDTPAPKKQRLAADYNMDTLKKHLRDISVDFDKKIKRNELVKLWEDNEMFMEWESEA